MPPTVAEIHWAPARTAARELATAMPSMLCEWISISEPSIAVMSAITSSICQGERYATVSASRNRSAPAANPAST
ncbi:hypothetical protein SMICM17S_12050 [Streptomyces microflavus]